jgi:hypothetical protein
MASNASFFDNFVLFVCFVVHRSPRPACLPWAYSSCRGEQVGPPARANHSVLNWKVTCARPVTLVDGASAQASERAGCAPVSAPARSDDRTTREVIRVRRQKHGTTKDTKKGLKGGVCSDTSYLRFREAMLNGAYRGGWTLGSAGLPIPEASCHGRFVSRTMADYAGKGIRLVRPRRKSVVCRRNQH